jgi:hypothetical protein
MKNNRIQTIKASAANRYMPLVTGILFDRMKDLDATCLRLDQNIDQNLLAQALELESEIWEKSGFNNGGSWEDYLKFLPQSRTYAVFKDDGKCLGVSRVFEGGPLLPPFLGLSIDDPELKDALEVGCKNKEVEEIGTAAVLPEVSYGKASLHMWRLAYRDAIAGGIKVLGIIMEPKRVATMNRAFGFCFEKIGPETFYQGGMCAAHILDLKKAQTHMAETNPKAYDWFVNAPLEQ